MTEEEKVKGILFAKTNQDLFDSKNSILSEEEKNRLKKLNSIHEQIKNIRKYYNESNKQYNILSERQLIELTAQLMIMIHNKKSATYGNSWKKRGWVVSIFGNIARKFDRLEKIFTNNDLISKFLDKYDVNSDEESIVDTLMDGGVYHFLAITEAMLDKPEMFDSWFAKTFNSTK